MKNRPKDIEELGHVCSFKILSDTLSFHGKACAELPGTSMKTNVFLILAPSIVHGVQSFPHMSYFNIMSYRIVLYSK